LLFEKEGSLRVLLTTRSKNLRSHPGQTALPGGMYDETDESLVATAVRPIPAIASPRPLTCNQQYREAFEEIALDTTSPHLRTIITLPPFISSKKVIVTPTIALLRDPSVLDTLVPSPAEVDLIFDHPVKAFLDPTIASGEHLAPMGSEQWVWESELHVRQHVPLGSRRPNSGIHLGFPRF
jgi:coenzyme A diphosphatase NUDT7